MKQNRLRMLHGLVLASTLMVACGSGSGSDKKVNAKATSEAESAKAEAASTLVSALNTEQAEAVSMQNTLETSLTSVIATQTKLEQQIDIIGGFLPEATPTQTPTPTRPFQTPAPTFTLTITP